MIDLMGAVVLALFVMLGCMRGTLASFLHIASLLVAYVAAFVGAPHLGALLAEPFELPRLVATAAGGLLIFVGSHLGLGVVSMVLRSMERRRRGGWPRGLRDRLGGGLLGAVQGGVILLLLGVLLSFVDAMRVSGGSETLARLPPLGDSRLVSTSQSLLAAGAQAALADKGPAGRMTLQLLAHPADTIERLQDLLTHPRIEALQKDSLFWSYVEHGAMDQALNRASFLGIAYDRTLRGELASLGMVGEESRDDPRAFRNAARKVLEQIAPRIQSLRDDPEFQALSQDPEIQAAVASGNTLQLIYLPQFRALVRRVLEES